MILIDLLSAEVIGLAHYLGDSAYALGLLKGTVTATGFEFKGNSGAGCEVIGGGAGTDTQLIGTAVFKSNCAEVFQDATFSVVPGC